MNPTEDEKARRLELIFGGKGEILVNSIALSLDRKAYARSLPHVPAGPAAATDPKGVAGVVLEGRPTGRTRRKCKITYRMALSKAVRAYLTATAELVVGMVGQILPTGQIGAQTVGSFALLTTGPRRRR